MGGGAKSALPAVAGAGQDCHTAEGVGQELATNKGHHLNPSKPCAFLSFPSFIQFPSSSFISVFIFSIHKKAIE